MARDRNGVEKSSKHFLMGPKGILHMDPAHEECNIDEIPRHRRQRFLTEDEAKAAGMRRRCEHCWPRVIHVPATESVAPQPAPEEPKVLVEQPPFG